MNMTSRLIVMLGQNLADTTLKRGRGNIGIFLDGLLANTLVQLLSKPREKIREE